MKALKDALGMSVGLGMFLCLMLPGLAYVAIGYIGIDHHLGWIAAFPAALLALTFRIILPISIGVFFAAKDVFDWHWGFALMAALPGLVLIVPGLAIAAFETVTKRR